MSSWWSLLLLAAVTTAAIVEGRTLADKPVSVMLDSYGNPMVFLREKRTPVGYPHRTMMFTGYYRPVRRTNDGQATGVFAEGNAVSGGSYVGDDQPDYLQRGPEPIEETPVSSSEAEAAPNPLEHHADEERREKYTPVKEQPEQEESNGENDRDSSDAATEAPLIKEPALETTKAPKQSSQRVGSKKTKKRPVVTDLEDSDEDEDEDDDDEDDELATPFIPFKSNRRRNDMPNLNNFFPMVFSYPRSVTRAGSTDPDSLPGMITAVANSYSTSKGGIASSVATAYGATPQGKKHRRAQPAHE